MHKKCIFFTITATVFLWFLSINNGFCYRVPTKESNIEYFYVFGANGEKTYGATNEPLVIFVRVPDSYSGEVEVSIYDPDCGSSIDEKSGKWDTTTKFSILGGDKAYTSILELDKRYMINGEEDVSPVDYYQGDLLDSKAFGNRRQYDKEFYSFKPIEAIKGEQLGGYRYFKIIAEGISGDDDNLFALDVSPDISEVFSFKPAIRLAETHGAKMALYPAIPSDATKILEYNYDLDLTGGTIELISPSRYFKINGSSTGMWASTEIDDVSSQDAGKRWVYEISKDRQKHANMAFTILTDKFRAIPIFFASGEDHAPMANRNPSCDTFTFDGSKSYDPDNTKLSYFWDFGDGTTSVDMRTIHTYKDAGKYIVQLTVKDTSDAKCNSATTREVVKVNQPPVAVIDGPRMSCVNEELTFDGSKTTDSPDDKLTYRWDFGDGQTLDGIKVKHTYERGGNYQVSLTVTDDSGTICDIGVDKLKLSINTTPIASAGKDAFLCRFSQLEPLEVTFDGSGSKDMDGDNLAYIWDFGDGETQEGKIVKHNYAKGGEYVAKLTVTDNTGGNCGQAKAAKKVILNRVPIADAGKDLHICAGEIANFDASNSVDNDGDNLKYTWDFGDGEKGEGKELSHKYSKGGIYQVELTVDDGSRTDCSSGRDKMLVDVNSTPKAVITSKDAVSVKQAVSFDGSGSMDSDGDKLGFIWDFGDGSSTSGPLTKHSYAKGGLYKVTLVVDDTKNTRCSSSTDTCYIKVNTPPTADAGPNLVCCVNDEAEFDGSRSSDLDGDKLIYTWDFGDGEIAQGVKVKHFYKKSGVYKVSLTVTDDSGVEGNSSTAKFVATVNTEPVPKIEIM